MGHRQTMQCILEGPFHKNQCMFLTSNCSIVDFYLVWRWHKVKSHLHRLCFIDSSFFIELLLTDNQIFNTTYPAVKTDISPQKQGTRASNARNWRDLQPRGDPVDQSNSSDRYEHQLCKTITDWYPLLCFCSSDFITKLWNVASNSPIKDKNRSQESELFCVVTM